MWTENFHMYKMSFKESEEPEIKLPTFVESSKKQENSRKTSAAAAKSLQSCPTLCDPTDGRPPGSTVPGILQARTLEWVAISFSNAWKLKVKVNSLSLVPLLATPWTATFQAPLSMGFSRQKYWSGVPLPSLLNGARNVQNTIGDTHTIPLFTILKISFQIHYWT